MIDSLRTPADPGQAQNFKEREQTKGTQSLSQPPLDLRSPPTIVRDFSECDSLRDSEPQPGFEMVFEDPVFSCKILITDEYFDSTTMDSAIRLETKKGDDSFEIINQLQRSLEEKDRQIESLSHHNRLLEEKINYLLQHRFGSKSERFDGRQQLLFEY